MSWDVCRSGAGYGLPSYPLSMHYDLLSLVLYRISLTIRYCFPPDILSEWCIQLCQCSVSLAALVSVFSITGHVTSYQSPQKYSPAILRHFCWLFVYPYSSEALSVYIGVLPSCRAILYYMLDAQFFLHHQLVLQRDPQLQTTVSSASAGAS